MRKLGKSTNGMSGPNNFPIPFWAIAISIPVWHDEAFAPTDGFEPLYGDWP